jgi:hypothetical protein
MGNLGFDAYLLKYEAGMLLPTHKDPVKNGRHYRINITLRGKGILFCEKVIFKLWCIYMFRPDLYEHSVFFPQKTLKLSLGFVKFV